MTTVENVYALTETILEFISENNFLKNVAVLQIFNVVMQFQNLMTPLLTRRSIPPYLSRCLNETQIALASAQRSLHESPEGRSSRLRGLLVQRSKSRNLKDDRELLVSQHVALLSAVQVVSHVKGFNIITPVASIKRQVESKSVQSLKMKSKMQDSDLASLFEAHQFWRCYIGSESNLAESEEFCEVLSLWMGEPLSDIACKRLLLRLDEDNMGTITFATFRDFIRQGNLRETVNLYASDPPLPLLVWIDHDTTAVIPRVIEATKSNIAVYQISSTATAKRWISINEGFLQEQENSGRIRILLSQVLHERNDYHLNVVNENAGHQITAFIRGLNSKTPILVYTSKSKLHLTKYVQDYDMIGSLGGNHLVLQAYVAALAGGQKDDTRWTRYNA
ncbi:hypothetical protein CPB83DRAFT_858767 [Crepidotus variabilis]|uniref:EF-hand domain-containing protein n=1 Tax=Crepidotus variabilis TaxID=179855 RepID=A0A9P6JM78_9AGAR|nr:hypothetical protein CPB83DRAFT_858767 [Crepidotus variabilis]